MTYPTKLSTAQVNEIYTRYGTEEITTRQLAKEYGVSHVLIWKIVTAQERKKELGF